MIKLSANGGFLHHLDFLYALFDEMELVPEFRYCQGLFSSNAFSVFLNHELWYNM